jgi:SulP family sulfate permease
MPDSDDIYRNIERYPDIITWPHICILRMDASLYFANAKFLENKVLKLFIDNKEIKYFILDGSGINDIDASAEETLRQLVTNLKTQKCEFFMTSLKGPVRDILQSSEFYKFLGEDHFFETISQAVTEVNS